MWLLKTEARTVPKKDVNEEGSIVQEILKTIEDDEIGKMVPLSEV